MSNARNISRLPQLGTGNASLMKNRIINGDMRIDQRNAGAAVTSNNNTIYSADRFSYFTNGSATGTLQQSNAAPVGFTNSLLYTVTSGSASGSTTRAQLIQRIEGYNVTDLNLGSANAKTITLSFWVRSSLTGTFGGSLQNSAQDRSYPFTYTISATNTWEQKAITIAGETSGTWLTNNGTGIQVYWDMGCGSSIQGTPGAWASADYRGATGTTSVVGTSGATFYITGVQLEAGSQATGYEYRQYQQELALCQRYFFKQQTDGTGYASFGMGYCASTTDFSLDVPYPVPPRTPATGITATSAGSFFVQANTNYTPSAVNFLRSNAKICSINVVTSGMTVGQGGRLIDANNACAISFNGMEL